MNLNSKQERRIFTAIPIPRLLQEKILLWEKKYAIPEARWLAGKNLHITLIPPWYEKDCEEAIRRLKKIEGSGEIDIEFQGVSYGPTMKEPRLIWASGDAPRKLLDLKEKAEETLGRKSECLPWLMHLTLARFDPRDFSRFPLKNLNEKVLWKECVSSVVLMESFLNSSGADYEIIAEAKLCSRKKI